MSLPPFRRRTLGLVSALAVTALLPTLRVRATAPPARVRVAVGGGERHLLRHLPLTVATQLDFFRPAGVDVTWLSYSNDALALQAVQSGVADVGAMGFEQAVRSQGHAVAVRSLVLQARTPQLMMAVSTRALPHYRSPEDLRRCKIGVEEWGGLAHAMALQVLALAGMGPQDVTFVLVGDGARALEALRVGKVQALCHGDPVMARLERSRELRVVYDTRSLAGTQAVFGGSVPGSCLAAPVPFLQAHPDRAQALAAGVVHALKWLQTAAPADIVKAIPADALMGDRRLFLAALDRVRESISPDGLVPQVGAQTAVKMLAVLDPTLDARPSVLAQSYTQEFARKAKQQFSA